MNKKLIIILFVLGLFFSQNASAAVEEISYVRQDCTGYTSCYTSLSAWEAAYGGINFTGCTVGDLTCVDKIAVAQIDGAWTLADTTPVVVDGWTTDVNRYIKIYTTTAARHSGKWDDTKYRLVLPLDNYEAVLNILANYTRVFGLQIDNNVATGLYSDGSAIKINGATSYIGYNIIRKNSGPSGTVGIYDYNGADYNLYVYNNIIYDNFGMGIKIHDYKSSPGTGSFYLENNTIYGNTIGIEGGYNAITGKKIKVANNNLLNGNSTDYSYAFLTSFANNISEDSTSPDRAYQNKAATFVDEVNGDLRLSALDTSAIDQGNTNPSSRITDSINGVIRTGAWDIGAYESVVIDTTPPTLLNRYPTGILPVGTTSHFLSVTTDSNATCKYSRTSGVSYSSMANTFLTSDSIIHKASISGLANGSNYTYYVRCKDIPGNANTSDYLVSFSVATPLTIIPDTTPPTIYLSSPAAGITVTGTYTTILAGAADNIAVSGVQFFVDGVSKGIDTTYPYSISWDTTNSGQHLCINDHTHALTAKATDTSGNTTLSSAVIVNMHNPSYCPPTSTRFSINDRVKANGILSVRDTPGGTYLGVQFTDVQGKIIGAPTYANFLGNNYWWWNIDYDTGVDGWTAEYLLSPVLANSYTISPIISLVTSSSVTATEANITWTTNEASDTQVEYGTTTSYGNTTTLNSSMITNHSMIMTGLTANTLYHYRAKSRNLAGNIAVSGDFTFMTRPTAFACGNSIIETGEQCDQGNNNGICPASCSLSCSMNSCSTANIPPVSTVTPVIPTTPVTPVVPLTPVGISSSDLQTQIDDLMAQIALLKNQQAVSSNNAPTACAGITFTRNLAVGSVGSDVKCLQALLNTSPLTQVATFGAGSPGNESIYFGPRTLISIATYQAQQGWTPAGQVGPLTRVKLNEWLNK